ncbi:hypothetical protein ccbrp13_38360 [Ktedonobacteria bacterium brp13]|nr:hypothetical protein ccbrp13_38360 [Ktedonobacteria bacterium brp13]
MVNVVTAECNDSINSWHRKDLLFIPFIIILRPLAFSHMRNALYYLTAQYDKYREREENTLSTCCNVPIPDYSYVPD